MPGKRLTPPQEIEAATLREAGYTITAIADRIGVSVSSLQRLFKRRSVSKGSVTEQAVNNTRESLLERLVSNDRIKEEVAKLITDDLAHTRMIREKAAVAAEALTPSDTTEAALTMRALVAYSSLIKNTSDVLRNDMAMSGASLNDLAEELPQLIVSEMTAEDIEEVKAEQRAREAA